MSVSSNPYPSHRLYLFLQGQRVLEVQQPAASCGARLPQVNSEGLHGLRWPACRPQLGLESPGGRGGPLRHRRRGRRHETRQCREHGESRGHCHPLRSGAVHDGPPLHRFPVQEEEHSTAHTVLQALHAGVGLRDCYCTVQQGEGVGGGLWSSDKGLVVA